MGNGALPHGLSSKAVWPPGDPARMAVRIIESVDVEPAPLRMVLGSQALEVRRNLMRGQPRFSVWVAFPFTLHSICLASGRGLPYPFRGLAGRCCSCLYSCTVFLGRGCIASSAEDPVFRLASQVTKGLLSSDATSWDVTILASLFV